MEEATSVWRLGHGTPAPLELLTGSGSMALIDEMLPVLEDLLLLEKHWIFIPDTLSNRALATLANALDPGQVAILQEGRVLLDIMVESGTFDIDHKRRVQAFAARAGEAMVIGGFRATPYAPGCNSPDVATGAKSPRRPARMARPAAPRSSGCREPVR